MSAWVEVATVMLHDHMGADEGAVIVSSNGRAVGLALTSIEDGDTELTLGAGELDQVIAALERARQMVQPPG